MIPVALKSTEFVMPIFETLNANSASKLTDPVAEAETGTGVFPGHLIAVVHPRPMLS